MYMYIYKYSKIYIYIDVDTDCHDYDYSLIVATDLQPNAEASGIRVGIIPYMILGDG